MPYPKLNVQHPGTMGQDHVPRMSCPPTTPIECAGYDEYLTMNDKPFMEWEVMATIGLVFCIMMIFVVRGCCYFIILSTQWEERRWVNRLVKAGPEERINILRSWCQDLKVNVEGTDIDQGEKIPLLYSRFGVSQTELREDIEEGSLPRHEELEKGPLI